MKICKSRYRIQAVMDDEPETTFLVQVGNATNPWQVTVTFNGVAVPFCIDTGAEVTVIPAGVFRKLSRTRLKPPVKILKGPSQNPLPVKGQFRGRLVLGHQTSQQDIYVVNNLHQPLLGRPAIEALGLLTCIRAVQDVTLNPEKDFPKLFNGLGKMEGDYTIKLRDKAQPFALSTPRRVAIPLMN